LDPELPEADKNGDRDSGWPKGAPRRKKRAVDARGRKAANLTYR
jgi:hypothetical protein